VTGAATVIQAIGAGQRAAASIDKALGGQGHLPEDEGMTDWRSKQQTMGRRPKPRVLSPQKRRASFGEIVASVSPTQACREARRCLRCDLEEK
jgi:NADH-quinone oxidoreductase subunit F